MTAPDPAAWSHEQALSVRVELAHERLDRLEAQIGHVADPVRGDRATGLTALVLEVRDAQQALARGLEDLRELVRADLDRRSSLGARVVAGLITAAKLAPLVAIAAALGAWLRANVRWGPP